MSSIETDLLPLLYVASGRLLYWGDTFSTGKIILPEIYDSVSTVGTSSVVFKDPRPKKL